MDHRMDSTMSMTIDRREVDALHSKYEGALRDWQNKYEKSERDLAEVSVRLSMTRIILSDDRPGRRSTT